MFKPLFVYHQKSTDDYFICDIFGNAYGQGKTSDEAINHAVSNGIEREMIE